MEVHIFDSYFNFLGKYPGAECLGCRVGVFNVYRKCQAVFLSDCIIVAPTREVRKFSAHALAKVDL
jgi:hypothetical protein